VKDIANPAPIEDSPRVAELTEFGEKKKTKGKKKELEEPPRTVSDL
jgi:hypothetical protein